MVKKEAYSKVEELLTKCGKFKTQELQDLCKKCSDEIYAAINGIHYRAERCNPNFVIAIYNLGREAGRLLSKSLEYERSEYETITHIIDALNNIISTVRDEVAEMLKEKCKCKLQ